MSRSVWADAPKASVIMPTYNRAPFLELTLASFTRQTERSYELVIVDDGSSDGTQAVVEITAQAGRKLIPLPEGASYLGFIFARGEKPEFVERALKEAHGNLRFKVAKEIPVL